jgi:hypothetical protein
MTDPAQQAKAAAYAFIDAFNHQDHEALADTLNYPHIRLANGRFVRVETRPDFVRGGVVRSGTRRRRQSSSGDPESPVPC